MKKKNPKTFNDLIVLRGQELFPWRWESSAASSTHGHSAGLGSAVQQPAGASASQELAALIRDLSPFTAQPWASCLTSLCLSFTICRTRLTLTWPVERGIQGLNQG